MTGWTSPTHLVALLLIALLPSITGVCAPSVFHITTP